jgi:hypothetical protein
MFLQAVAIDAAAWLVPEIAQRWRSDALPFFMAGAI